MPTPLENILVTGSKKPLTKQKGPGILMITTPLQIKQTTNMLTTMDLVVVMMMNDVLPVVAILCAIF